MAYCNTVEPPLMALHPVDYSLYLTLLIGTEGTHCASIDDMETSIIP